MGGSASTIKPEIFSLAKDEYELKKVEGLTDEQLFNHMKAFIETKTAEFDAAVTSALAEEGSPPAVVEGAE